MWRYGVAPIGVVMALAVHALLTPLLHSDSIFLYFLPPVLIAAAIGGFGPGLLATVMGVVAAYAVIPELVDF